MKLTHKLLLELQNRLKVGNRRGVHLNAIPGRSRYKFDLNRLSHLDEKLPQSFIDELLSQMPLKFRISWKDNVPDLNSLFEEDQAQLVKITKSFENLINQTEAIESEKGLNTFGFGFPLLIRRDQKDNKLTVAPILIWSLRIKRSKEFNTWIVQRNEDDPIYMNEVLINHLQNDSQVSVDQVSTEMLEDGLIDQSELIEICLSLVNSINSITPEGLKETFREKLSSISAIPDKKYFEKLPLTSNNSFVHFGGLFSIFEVQKQNIILDYSELMELEGMTLDLEDLEEHSFQPLSSVETDPSQQGILHSLESTRNILIQGPPGTGKSQSLTAVLINALENNKRTVVVCEKRTALEVLQNALFDRGLGQQSILIKDIVKDRRAVVNSVRDRVDNSYYKSISHRFSKEPLDNVVNRASSLIKSINKRHKKLGVKIFGNYGWPDTVGALLSKLKTNEEDFEIEIDKTDFDYTSKELNELLGVVRDGQDLFSQYLPISESSFLNPDMLIGENPYIIEERILSDLKEYEITINSILKEELDYQKDYYELRKKELNAQTEEASEILNEINRILNDQFHEPDLLDEQRTGKILYRISAIFSKNKQQILSDQSTLKELQLKLVNCFIRSKDLGYLESIKSLDQLPKGIELAESLIKKRVQEFKAKIDSEYEEIDLLEFDEAEYVTSGLEKIQEACSLLSGKITNDNWLRPLPVSEPFTDFVYEVKNILERSSKYFDSEADRFIVEFQWWNYYNSLSANNKSIIDSLQSKDDWEKVFYLFYLNSLLTQSATTELPTNDGEHQQLAESLKKIGDEQLKYIKDYWYSKQLEKTREFEYSNPGLSVANLYNKRKSHKHKRLSLRKIVQYDPDLFTTYFPIILTTPDVCSNLFKGMNQFFDIVLFDEASQLRLEDNLPALLKGKQIIIAGDEHQMPPSNYFSKIFDGTIEDEDNFDDENNEEESYIDRDDLLLSCESLLDFASELRFEKRYLDFHYRSRHPYLIDFSNHAFYNKRLKPLPNSFDYAPISYLQVNGTYSDHSNEREAEAVLSILENNINRLPNGNYPSVGIATFNISQRNLIKRKIIERQKFPKYDSFNQKILELEESGLFVKNLENIQGDERDVIILSTTYGINMDGKFAQRFGPINHKKGYKLLNVIVTRAKYKIYVCSSIPEDVFLNYKQYLITEGSNNRRAVFFAYLAYAKAVSEKDNIARQGVLDTLSENSNEVSNIDQFNSDLESPFEEEVFQAISEHFDSEKLFPQLQFAGFRIDIVYDSKIEGVPRIAIECDGAAYHSSKEAYLYDYHRQKILENHGFVFHRIWSTNWWRNAKRETNKLVRFIQSVESRNPAENKGNSKLGQAFTDDFSPLFINREEEPIDQLQGDSRLENLQDEISFNEQTDMFANVVQRNSTVKVKYLNNGKDLIVKLSESTKNRYDVKNGIQSINAKSPLAVSILGKSIGDTVKVGKLDNYVEIIEIEN